MLFWVWHTTKLPRQEKMSYGHSPVWWSVIAWGTVMVAHHFSKNIAFSSLLMWTLFGGLGILYSGKGDTRYIAKKWAWNFVVIMLLGATGEFLMTTKMADSPAIFLALSWVMLLGAYPFNSWCDGFFMRSHVLLVDAWLVVVRPIIACALWEMLLSQTTFAHAYSARLGAQIVAAASLFFVPILFFSKQNIGRLSSCLMTWQSGYLLLLLLYAPSVSAFKLFPFVFAQGMFLAIFHQNAMGCAQGQEEKSLEQLTGVSYKDPFAGMYMASALCFFIAIPIVMLMKIMTGTAAAIIMGSLILPAIYFLKMYRKWSKKPEEGRHEHSC